MKTFYTQEKQALILIALLKKHGIKKIIASPGATNICFVASIQSDPYFEIYSAPDERSAAYIACGMSVESGETVVLTCTGATASRNYVPGLTEAFYRKIPILAVTSTQPLGRIGHNIPQVIDRRIEQNDIFRLSIQILPIYTKEDKWACETQINKAILELRHRGNGPVHINLTTNYNPYFDVKELPNVKVINRICYGDSLPKISSDRIAIYVGAHTRWNEKLVKCVDEFCFQYNAVVLCDQTSNYKGSYKIMMSLPACQDLYKPACYNIDLLIYIGDISGADVNIESKRSWRVNPDGEVRDTFRNLQYVFEMEEVDFFKKYLNKDIETNKSNTFFIEWNNEYKDILNEIPELPFSNVWIAQHTASKLPEDSVLHLGILNSLRAWNFFDVPNSVLGYSNTGGFGIDGNLSSFIGASLVAPEKLFFCIIGDLAFFYDMNSLGNHHIGRNIRIMLINNGRGTEFRNYNHLGARFGEDADAYIAAAGHYGNKSPLLIKHYAEDLGFKYLCASNKEEYLKNMDEFLDSRIVDKPVLFEVFTDSKDESEALETIRNIKKSPKGMVKGITKIAIKNIFGQQGIDTVKKIIKR